MEREAWLAQAEEEVLEPELEICDAHHHLWEGKPGRGRYLQGELLADVERGGHRVVSSVFVECGAMYRPEGPEALRPVGETEFVDGVVVPRGAPRVAAGIVSHADLTLGDGVRSVLEAHRAASPDRFRGIRHSTRWDPSGHLGIGRASPPPGLLGDATFRRGFALLGELGLSFDAWLYHPQISELTALARAFPHTTIVLDHFGGPLGVGPYAGRRGEVFADWRRAIGELATCPNVVVKIGGLQMRINGFGWHERDRPPGSEELAAAIRPYTLAAIEAFGPERCLFESNFPVDKLSCSYRVLWNAFKRVAASFSPNEKRLLFHDTAERIYNLTNGTGP